VVDVFREPRRALADGVFMTPTLVKLGPAPVRRIVGTLGQLETVLIALGLDAIAA
jgi:circadian clock protein KaiB